MLKRCLYTILLAACFIRLYSQENFVFSVIDSNKGLSQNHINYITQLQDGRMVIIADGLLNIYDGISFNYWHRNDEKTYPLQDYSGYTRVYIGNEGLLWVKDYYHLSLFDIKTERFISNIDSVFKQRNIPPIKNLFIDTQEQYWFLTHSNRIICKCGEKEILSLRMKDLNANANDPLYDIAVIEKQAYFFFKSGSMVCYDIPSQKVVYQENPWGQYNDNYYTKTLHVVPYKNFLYQTRNGTDGRGIVLCFDTVSKQWKTLLETHDSLNTLSIDSTGNCWVSSPNGFWIINVQTGEDKHITDLHLANGNKLQTNINTQFHDKNGGLWVGTNNRGILYYHPDRFKFNAFGRTQFGIPESKDINVLSFATMGDSIIVGTDQGAFFYRHTKQNTIPPQLHPISQLPSGSQYLHMHTDSCQRVWIGTDNSGLYCLHPNAVLRHYNLPVTHINYLWENSDNTLYLCTTQGLALFDPSSGKYEYMDQGELGQVFQLTKYQAGQLIGISEQGFFICDPNTKVIKLLDSSSDKYPMLHHSNHKCHCIFTDSRGLTWFGTQDGLNVWDNFKRKLFSFYSENGLSNNCIYAIQEDDLQRIWITSANGISRIDLSKQDKGYSYSFINYNRYDGIIENEFIPRSSLLAPNNLLLCGGLNGFNSIELNHLTNNSLHHQPVPIFTDFYLFGNEIKCNEPYDGHALLSQSITTTRELFLSHKQNFLEFHIASLNYVNPNRTYYRYQLNGNEDNWHEIHADNGLGRINYTNLPPGKYILKVYAANGNKIWSDECAQLAITITPPFYKTTAAIALYVILMILCVYFILYSWHRSSKKKMMRIQKEELNQLKFQFFTNISHELRTPLTLIITPLDTLIKKTTEPDARNSLEVIRHNANNLLKLVNQLLDYRKLEMGGEKANLCLCNLHEIFRAVAIAFEEIATRKNLSLTWQMVPDHIYLYADSDKLYKIISNLVSNACKFTPAGGKISLHAQSINKDGRDFILIEVADDGCGISERDLPHIFERFYQTAENPNASRGSGIGLHLVQQYVKLHHGDITVKSKRGQGTTFSIWLPVDLHPESELHTVMTSKVPGHAQLKIMLVEDNPDLLNFLAKELSHYTIFRAINGKDALAKIRQEIPDIIISDLIMPEMDGIELCKHIKEDISTSHIPFILLSARSDEKEQIKAYAAGANIFLPKPFNMEILQLHIQHFVEQQQNRKKNFRKALVIDPSSITTTPIDEQLLKKALQCVENNIDNSAYTVEQFSKDMCMDRTGLYRKLTALSGLTPSAFIRSIRLKHAIRLLEQGISVAEVTDRIGFGTTGYFSKCFQEEFGVKPSQYANKNKTRNQNEAIAN